MTWGDGCSEGSEKERGVRRRGSEVAHDMSWGMQLY